ncbi:MAG TPA: YIP1 family protein [Pirellulales bacterium]|nr:YIP1 family protein [Pirellulales bacterium]
MPIEFRCNQCSKLLRVGDETAGKQAKCPSCGTVQTIPASSFSPPLATPEVPSSAPPSPFAPVPGPVASDNPYASPTSAPLPPAGEYYDRFPASRRTGPPWERDGASFASFFETAKEAFTATPLFFSEMRREGGLGAPLFYGLAGGSAGALVGLLMQSGMQMLLVGLGGANGMGGPPGVLGPAVGAVFTLVFGVILIPIGMIFNMFILSGMFHLMLMMLGAARYPFETTFRVVAYSLGSSSLLGLIPICGQAINGIVNLVFVGIGLSHAHEISGLKATAAVLLPMVICCGAAVGLYILVMAMVVAGAR